jgi:glycosyltransferase involved in cell wall biosynthesis
MNTDPIIQIDNLTEQAISGWFSDPSKKLGKKLHIEANGQKIGSFSADLSRIDVGKALDCDPHCGFNFKFHKPLKGQVKLAIFGGKDSETLLKEMEFENTSTVRNDALGHGEKNIYFDVSDLIYFVGHHDNLTGIQRVQSCIILSLTRSSLHPSNSTKFLSYNNRTNEFITLDSFYFTQLLEDLFLPHDQRTVYFDQEEAKIGILPGFTPLSADPSKQNVLCLLGAAWVNKDYFARILELKRAYSFRFVMTVHDLIPIYAAETCDQGTTKVFKTFLNEAYRYTDAFLSVSRNTAADIERYAHRIGATPPPIHVTLNGSHFNDFIDEQHSQLVELPKLGITGDYVLFVSTIEGRKNHQLMFDVWRNMIDAGIDTPTLVCVGRNGWRAEEFLNNLISTNYLKGKIKLLSDISDLELAKLYEKALFSVYPSLYEGWGLPVGESLAKGKICVTCRNSSLPEVAGEFGVYIDPVDTNDATFNIQRLITDHEFRLSLETKIKSEYSSIPWSTVAENTIRAALSSLSTPSLNIHAAPTLGMEYSFASVPEYSGHQFGDNAVREIERARKLPITRKFGTDDQFIIGSEIRRGKNWCVPETWGCWSKFGVHELSFAVNPADRSESGYIIYLSIQANPILIGERIEYKLNGQTLYSEIIGECKQTLKIVIEIDLNPRVHDRNFIVLHGSVSASRRQQEEMYDIDTRTPGIGYKSILIIANEDLTTRLSVLENLAIAR